MRSRDGAWWRTWVLGTERQRQRREERTFTNSAIYGLVGLVLGASYAAMCFALDVDGVFSYSLAAWIAWLGGANVWRGIGRWRAGGEFNLPGRAGPMLRTPPRDIRGN